MAWVGKEQPGATLRQDRCLLLIQDTCLLLRQDRCLSSPVRFEQQTYVLSQQKTSTLFQLRGADALLRDPQ